MSAPKVVDAPLQPQVVAARGPSAAVHLVVFAAAAVAAFFIYGLFY
ncbi:MAG TPA: hypothetical protein VGM39_01975 [Kofleriaceae bacterium]